MGLRQPLRVARDTTTALDLLLQHGRAAEIHPHMEEEIRLNREADYAGAVVRRQHMKLGFVQHSVMISRLHFMLEMASRNGRSEVELGAWRQGADLRGHEVDVPEIRSRRVEGSNEYVWEEHDHKTQRLPAEPDALFTLHLPNREPDHLDRLENSRSLLASSLNVVIVNATVYNTSLATSIIPTLPAYPISLTRRSDAMIPC